MSVAKEINKRLNTHYKGGWSAKDIVSSKNNWVSISCGESKTSPKYIANFILKNFPSVDFVECGTTIYTRYTLTRTK